ncbi:MAG: hypothetical protein U0271_36160 [Polyangiaceae bacterium]
MAFTWSACFAIGMAAGGLAVTVGPEVALAVDAATFVVAAFLLRRLPAIVPLRESAEEFAPRYGSRGASRCVVEAAPRPHLRAGPDRARGRRGLDRAPLGGHMHAGRLGAPIAIGLLQAVRGGSTALGPIALEWASRSREPSKRLAWIAASASLVGSLGVAAAPSLVVALVAAAVWGAGGGALWMIMSTEIQRRASDAMRGRLIALAGLGFTTAMVGGAWLGAHAIDAGAAASGIGAALTVVGGVVFAVLHRDRDASDARVYRAAHG